ncbi:hypothetical protein MWM28_06770 [Flavobacterium psychrophilum]|uniref:hypothetical protein n=1 Tax=Flavobacterium psychrophilum TaxID=96345 RepID=UPI00106ADABE|nr:hypothetical protein [Flavobacterium psychrophilum]MCB5981818.1 hypothetical protein [Flavobacterium psychrophilum]MCB6012675.1 hypothetical protein [Flavobacterium psychrophilum]MCB6017620.1 hypothetical protein [Flavobacterium psychrophilum]MCB6025157.1 hypothetical protein [Flavobacterium psychrophilum]MCB6030031.1 hypothetical protein [Flavobacterium psychrophilum]
MKKAIFILIFSCTIQFSIAQSGYDTKDFITEQISANPPMSNYKTAVFFDSNALKFDIERVSNRTLNENEFSNSFIFMYDIFNNLGTINLLSKAHIIDIRDIIKVSTTKISDKVNYYNISVYIGHQFYSKEYSTSINNNQKWEYLDKMQIIIGDNYEASQKIKKAIIYLGKIQGITIKDGDLF